MTDETGMIQHALLQFQITVMVIQQTTMPVLSYKHSVDKLGNSESSGFILPLSCFPWVCIQRQTKRFRNFMDYQRNWLKDKGSDDSHGRALWSLGTLLSHSNTPAFNSMAGWLFEQTLPSFFKPEAHVHGHLHL